MATQTRGFRFDLNRAIQASAVVLRDRGPMDRLRLLKILYYANRDSLKKSGSPIIGGKCSALKNGPLHSEVYDQIKGVSDDREWRNHFRNKSHTIELINDPGRLDLSPFEISILDEIANWADSFETFELSEKSHELEEWVKNAPQHGTSNPIYTEDILQAIGFQADDIEYIINENRSHDQFNSMMD